MKRECYHNKFYGDQCQNIATWKSNGAGNFTDEWTWCDAHAPDPRFRELLEKEKGEENG